MRKKICSVLVLFLMLTVGCTKDKGNEDVVNPTVSNAEDTRSTREKLIDEYWVGESSSGERFYKNFTYKKVITLDPYGMDDLKVETVEGILENDDNSVEVIGNLTDYNGSVEIEYKLDELENGTDLNVDYYFNKYEQSESDATPETIILMPISLEQVRSEMKEFYKEDADLQYILDTFEDKIDDYESVDSYDESSSKNMKISKDEAHRIAKNHYDSVGTSIEGSRFIVVDYVHNGKLGYTVEDSGQASMIDLYNMGVLFIDGNTGEITVVEGPDDSESRGEDMLEYIDYDEMWE